MGEPLRVPYGGRLRDLENDWQSEVRPSRSAWADYVTQVAASATPDLSKTIFDEQIVILNRTSGVQLGLESTLLATQALRGAVLDACPDPAPEWLSGHRSNGDASQLPHLALAPLPHIGRKHADGHLLGLAIILPRGVATSDQRRCLGPLLFAEHNLPRELILTLGKAGVWQGGIETSDYRPLALRSSTWTGPARMGDGYSDCFRPAPQKWRHCRGRRRSKKCWRRPACGSGFPDRRKSRCHPFLCSPAFRTRDAFPACSARKAEIDTTRTRS